jgi:hypothetical protein
MADSDLFNKSTRYAEIYQDEILLKDDKGADTVAM